MKSLRPIGLLLAVTTAALHGADAPDESQKDPVKLESFVVEDKRDSAYKAATAITGTKTDTPLINVPQNITGLTKDLIDDMAAVDITDLYPLMGAVTEFSYGGVSMRGFRQEQTRYNGISGVPQSEFGVLTLDNVEQVEVLKGPVGLLYGDNEPGGMINIVTAKPKATFGGQVGTRFGSWGQMGANARVTGPIDAKKRFLYLASASYLERDSFRANYHQETLNLSGALTWVISQSTRATASIERIEDDQHGARLRGIPYGANGWAGPYDFNSAEPTDYQKLATTVYGLQVDHVFADFFRLNSYVRYFNSRAPQAYHEPNTFNATTGIWPREFRHQLREIEELSWAINGVADFKFLGAKHKILTGAEYNKQNRVFRTRTVPQAQVVPINVRNPVYGQSNGSMYDISLAAVTPTDTDKIRLGYYLQDQVNIREKVYLLAGARYELFTDRRRRPSIDEFEDGVVTYRGGAVYMLKPNFAVFVSYAMGLKPQSLGDEDKNGPFPPQESSSWEGGIKLDLFDNRLGITSSAYEIVKTNVLERDPRPNVPSTWLAPIGEVQSRGVELDINGQVTANFSLVATYAYNDAAVKKSNLAASPVGSRFPNAPRHKGGLFARYNLPRLGLGFSAGASYVGERPNFSGATNFPGPAYTVYNAGAFYRWKNLLINARVENVFDKKYAKSVFTTDGHFPGNPRNLTVTATYKF